MNKQLVQDIIKAGNKAMDIVHIKYTVDTKDNRYLIITLPLSSISALLSP